MGTSAVIQDKQGETVEIEHNALNSIEYSNYNVYQNKHYYLVDYVSLASAGIGNFVLDNKDKNILILWGLTSNEYGILGSIYEGITCDNNGTIYTANNSNRNSNNKSSMIMRYNPTNIVITNAKLIRNGINGTAGGIGNRISGNIQFCIPVSLKKNTKYLIRVTNLGNSTNNINFDINYDETD